MGRDEGLSEVKLVALSDYEGSDAFTPVERAVLRLADAMVGTPAEISTELFVSLREHFDDAQLAELASALAWENYRARFNRVFDVEAEGYSEGAFCPLPAGHVGASPSPE